MDASDRLIVALDVAELAAAERAMDALSGVVSHFKVGLELFTAAGPAAAHAVTARGHKLFLDLKLHDIPNTVAAAVRAAALLGAELLTLHASGGTAMIAAARAAADAIRGAGLRAPMLLAVTVLTSLDDDALAQIGLGLPEPVAPAGLADPPGAGSRSARTVAHLGLLALAAGADGLVCSPNEAAMLRRAVGAGPLLVTPGVRAAGSARGDQARVATPAAAMAAGASHLVIGRPILSADSPRLAAMAILEEMSPTNRPSEPLA